MFWWVPEGCNLSQCLEDEKIYNESANLLVGSPAAKGTGMLWLGCAQLLNGGGQCGG